jgi:HD-GYP domain-containing protein (c-di-GMP phosphodiesterase class II)
MKSISVEQYNNLLDKVGAAEERNDRLLAIAALLSSKTTLDTLLAMLLAESRNLAQADAGSIYVRNKTTPGGTLSDTLRFKIAQNDSIPIHQASEYSVRIDDSSIAGYVAKTGQMLNIPDVHLLPTDVPYAHNPDWDKKFSYPVKSMLTLPLKNLSGDVVGVLQLINKKNKPGYTLKTKNDVETIVNSFTSDDENLVCSLGSLAAVSIERVQLYNEIEAIFEGFLQSSIAAIDGRDSITSGHSRRVMDYALAFADAVNNDNNGVFKDIHFSEARKKQFRFAALLHDVGKIGVPEELLRKATRLSPPHMDALQMRVDYIRLLLRTRTSENACTWKNEEELDNDIAFIDRINRTDFLPDGDIATLRVLREKTFITVHHVPRRFLTDYEWEALSVAKGNLSAHEREIIKSHALTTRRILSDIPWTQDMKDVPLIAGHHHEKLDGSGYPDQLCGNQISFESKALAVIDIYEALTARERPFKPRMPAEKAMSIIRNEAVAGHLDTRIVEFFINNVIHSPQQTHTNV